MSCVRLEKDATDGIDHVGVVEHGNPASVEVDLDEISPTQTRNHQVSG
jgi:hypothetical protein